MRPEQFTRLFAAGLALVALAACTSHTAGSGSHSGSRTPSAPSTPVSITSSTPEATDSLTPSSTPSSTTSASSPVLQQTNLVITRSSWDAVGHTVSAVAILPGKVIEQGTCTMTITLGAVSKTVTKPSTPDASSTDCGLMKIDGTGLAAGNWSGTVTFAGGGVTATSATFPVTVTS